jgi:hypothetical protein
MGNWIIRWNFNKQLYSPGESAFTSFWLENTGNTCLYLSKLKLDFDFGTYNLESISGIIPLRANKFLGNVNLLIPKNVVSTKIFTIKYTMHEYINNNWVDLGHYQPDKKYFISVYQIPFYKVFISRGLSVEDRAIGNPIAEMIKEWGFKTVTVGIEVKVHEEQVLQKVKEEIRKADALIAISTPRYVDALTGLWKTLEWLHDEVGIAFGINKPLLILKDKRVSLGGLPAYLANKKQASVVEFDPYNINEITIGFSTIMPSFREWIETKRKQDFIDVLGKIAVGGLAVVGGVAILCGIIGTIGGASKG